MSQQPGCKPSALIESIYYGLPYFTGGTINIATNVSVDDILQNVVDNLVRAGGWAGILLAIVVLISICTCFYCCCTCVVCSVRQREKPLALKVVLGLVTGGIMVVAIIILFVLFWAETALHGDITGELNTVGNMINNFSDPSVYEAINLITGIDGSRHLAFIIYLVILLLFLLAVLTVVVLAPVCKSGVGVLVALIITGFFTITNGILVASVFAVIVVYTQYCVLIFSVNIPFICDEAGTLVLDPAQDPNIYVWLNYLNVFCNNSVEHGFTIFMLSVVLVILFILIQIFGIAYAMSFFGTRRESVAVNIQADESGGAQLTGYSADSYITKDNVPLTNVVQYQ